MYRNIK